MTHDIKQYKSVDVERLGWNWWYDVWLRAWQSGTSAHGEIAMAAQQGIEIVGADTTAGVRLGKMGQFFARLSQHTPTTQRTPRDNANRRDRRPDRMPTHPINQHHDACDRINPPRQTRD